MLPYLIRRPGKPLFALAAVSVALLLSAGASSLAAAPAMANSSWCSTPELTQPFLAWGDQNFYTLVRGQDDSGFNGYGWTLTGGANVVDTQLYDGSTGGVLDLPSGSKAVSPAVCVNSTFPDARMMVNDVAGNEGVEVYVSYKPTNAWSSPWGPLVDAGPVSGGQSTWGPSNPVSILPPGGSNWQLARFTFVPGGTSSEFQIYDFYLDPYGKG